MAEQYNPEILQKYADVLYSQARSLAVWIALRYGVLLAVVVWLALAIVSPFARMRIDTSSANTCALIAGFIGLLIGYNSGKVKAFSLLLQAQQVLCQRQIELNTRKQEAAQAASQAS
jgi:membrane associated rhomboid family serine protease